MGNLLKDCLLGDYFNLDYELDAFYKIWYGLKSFLTELKDEPSSGMCFTPPLAC